MIKKNFVLIHQERDKKNKPLFFQKKFILFLFLLILGTTLFVFSFLIQPVPAISVILPTYNHASLLPRAIDSILNQTFKDFELIIINDGSIDETAALLKRYAAQDKRIRILTNKKNKGIAVSLNRGLESARGVYIARMDDDDISLPERFEKQKAFLDTHPEITVVGSERDSDVERNKILSYIQVPVFHPSVLIRRAFLTQHQIKYDSTYESAEDTPFWHQIVLKGGQITNMPERLVTPGVSEKKEGYYARQAHSFLLFLKTSLAGFDIGEYFNYPLTDKDQCYIFRKIKQKNQQSKQFNPTALESLIQKYCAQTPERVLPIQHPLWKDLLLQKENGQFCRNWMEKECGRIIEETDNSIIFKWDAWGTEVFIKQPDGGYHLQTQ